MCFLFFHIEPETGCSLQEKVLIGFFPAIAVLILALVAFLTLLVLFRNNIHFAAKKSPKCSYDTEKGQNFADKPEKSGTVAEVSKDIRLVKVTSITDPHTTVTTVLDPHAVGVIAKDTPTLKKYPNPIANMLLNVAFLIRNKDEPNQDMTAMTAIDHILGEVLGRTDISGEAVRYMEDLKGEVNIYQSKIRARRIYRRNLSRSTSTVHGNTVSPSTTQPVTHPTSNEEIHKASKLCLLASSTNDVVVRKDDADSDDDSDSEECNQIKIAENIAEKLYQWLSRHRPENSLGKSGENMTSASNGTEVAHPS